MATLPHGLAIPYPTHRVFRGFQTCLGEGRHAHEGIDLGGVGPDGGLGSAVRSMVRARVTRIATGAELPGLAGKPDRRPGLAKRVGGPYPKSREVLGYGEVFFFTRRHGHWRTGTMLVTEGLDSPLQGHRVRYLHLAAVRPDLKVGDIVEAGEEIGLLGGTAVQEDAPHLHFDIRDPEDQPVDPAPLMGLGRTAWCGSARKRGHREVRAFRQTARGIPDWRLRTWLPAFGDPTLRARGTQVAPIDLVQTPPALVRSGLAQPGARIWQKRFGMGVCGRWEREDDFATGAYEAHAYDTKVWEGQVVEVTLRPEIAGTRWSLTLVNEVTGHIYGPELARVLDDLATGARSTRLRLALPADGRLLVWVQQPEIPDVDRITAGPAGAAPSVGAYKLTVRTRCGRRKSASTP
ncbi:MAG: hypothetical protein ACI9MR_000182 [Myxococcota bacterium]|jgi:hypothetical protein